MTDVLVCSCNSKQEQYIAEMLYLDIDTTENSHMVNHKDNTNSYIFYILKCKISALNK